MIDEEATFEKFGYYSTDWAPKSHKKIIVVCDDCGKVRVMSKYSYHARCKACANKGERHPLFGKYHSEETRKKMSDAHKGAKNWNWKGGLAMRICEQCGVEFPVRPFKIKRGEGKFCSPECYGKWRSKHLRGKNNANWQGGKIKQVCQICGKVRYVKPSKIKQGGGKFCSPKCHGKWLSKHNTGKNNPSYRNGASFEPYCIKWNEPFREYIREKFHRVCFLCGKTEKENGQRLSVHHVNGNKNCGCDDDETCQFVPLCVSCHSKMLSKKVDWEKKIKDKMQNKLSGWYI